MEEPVHKNDDNKWYFWDETWTEEIGPYDTEDECKKAICKYARERNLTI